MENYKVQFRIDKKDLPKSKDEALQKETIKNKISNGSASLSMLEISDEGFDYPSGSSNFPEWKTKFDNDLFVEFELLLRDNEAKDESHVRNLAADYIQNSNALAYLYDDDLGRHVCFCTIVNDLTVITDKDWQKQQKEEEKEKKQLNLFKKKGKSK